MHIQGPVSEGDKLVYNGAGQINGATLTMPSLTKPVVVRNADIHFAQNAASLDNLDASLGFHHFAWQTKREELRSAGLAV